MAKIDLNEAIADAKQLRKTAEANAKIAIAETFQPTLQRMISTKIAEEEGDDEELDIDIEIAPEEAEPAAEPVGMGSFEPSEEGGEEPPVEDEPDPELESLMRELEGSDDEFELGEADEFGDMEEGEEESWSDPIAEEEDEYDPENEYGLTEAEWHAVSRLAEEEGLGDIDGSETDDGGDVFTASVPSSNMNTEVRKLRSEVAKLKGELNKAYRAVTEQKTVINQVNLLNAKLMYAQKAARFGKLSEDQSVKVLKAIDRAKSVREVKLVYTSVLEALNRGDKKRSVTENYASKPIKQVGRKTSLNENSQVVAWQRLAGILPPADY